jgi:hypothetical protein
VKVVVEPKLRIQEAILLAKIRCSADGDKNPVPYAGNPKSREA